MTFVGDEDLISSCLCDSSFLYPQRRYHFKELRCSAQRLTQAMKLHKLFQLAYDVHTCRMIPRLVIILEGDMCTSGLHKRHDRFQTLLSQLKIHGAGVSHEDANQKFLRSLPYSWSQVALIMRTKPGLDTLIFDDLYNNLKVFERDVKGTTASSSSNIKNMAFVSVDNTSSTNDVSIAYSVSSPSVSKSQKEGSASYTDEVIHSFFANQSSAPQLDCDDLEQIDDDGLEEMDFKWQGHFARDYKAKWNQDSRRRDGGYNGNKARDNSRRLASQDD
nr:hypothetical protein [Tanacetum cinerariifolium]